MTTSQELHCRCIRCDGLLEFPKKRSGEVMQCYHCGLETWLHADANDLGQAWNEPAGTSAPRRIPIRFRTSPPAKVPLKLPPKSLKYALLGLTGLVVAVHLFCLGFALAS